MKFKKFFKKFGDRPVYFQEMEVDRPVVKFDFAFTVEKLAVAIEGRILTRMPLALKKGPVCEHKDHSGRPYNEVILDMVYSTKSYRYCPLCGDKLE